MHDAVRRANPNQFVMTLFSSRASLASCAAKRDFCLCLRACLQAAIEYSRETRVRATQLFIAAPRQPALYLHDMPPAHKSVHLFSICMVRRRGAKSEIKRAAMNGKKRQLDPEFPSASALCEICVAVFL